MSEPQKLPTLQIPADVINPIIESHVRDAVIRAFDGYQPMVGKLIQSVLNVRVDENGKPCRDSYSERNAPTWLDWVLGDMIRSSVRTSMQAHFEAMKESLSKHIVAELQKKNSPLAKQVARSMLEGLGSVESMKWRLKVDAVVDER